MKEKQIILDTSDEAAKFVENISGWVDSKGFFFGKDECAARYSGCTHRACELCGELAEKIYIHCNSCREKRQIELYTKREREEWLGDKPVYSLTANKYFNSWDEVYDYVDIDWPEDVDRDLNKLRLVICEPVFLTPISGDHWEDCMPDDDDRFPESVSKAIEEFNKVLLEAGPVSYVPGKFAVQL